MKTLLTAPKLDYLIELLLTTKGVQGAVAEIGVFHGGCLEAIAKQCQDWDPRPGIVGYDTFSGLPKPLDYEFHNQGEFEADEVEVRRRFEPYPNVQLIRGVFPDSHRFAHAKLFRFVHLDVDLYDSTKKALPFIWTLLNENGVLVCDDYQWHKTPGVTKAIDEFMETFKIKPIGKAPHGSIAFRKPTYTGLATE